MRAEPLLLRQRTKSCVSRFVPASSRCGRPNNKGFTLVELLSVVGIMAILIGITVPSIPGLKGSKDTTKAASDIAGILEYARTQAMAGNTYTWVGFFEEDPTVTATTPQTKGKGQLVIAVVSSSDGTNLSTELANSKLPGSSTPTTGSLTQISKILRIPNIHVDTSISTLGTIPFPTTTAAITPYEVDPTAANQSGTTFDFPFTGAAQYNFSQIIQFNPQGDASEIYSSPTQAIDIGLRPARGDEPLTNGNGSKNVVVIRIEGIGGKVTIYRP